MSRHTIRALALVSVIFAACSALPTKWGTSEAGPAAAPNSATGGSETLLYARDGSVVSQGNSSAAANLPRREVQNQEGSRTKILELYERVVEERDQLRLAVSARDSELARLRQQLDREVARANGLESRVLSAEQASVGLAGQNLELAARLTTAQIKRLEAEKKWLELAISLPAKVVAAAPATSANGAREKTEPVSMPVAKPTTKPGGDTNEHH